MAFYFIKQHDIYGASLKHEEDLERAWGTLLPCTDKKLVVIHDSPMEDSSDTHTEERNPKGLCD